MPSGVENEDEIKFHVRTLQASCKRPKYDNAKKVALEISSILKTRSEIDEAVLLGVETHLKAAKRLLLL